MDYLHLKKQMVSVSTFCFPASKGTVFQFVGLKKNEAIAGSCALLFYTSMFDGGEVLPVYLQKSHLPNQTWPSGDLIKPRFSLAVWVK